MYTAMGVVGTVMSLVTLHRTLDFGAVATTAMLCLACIILLSGILTRAGGRDILDLNVLGGLLGLFGFFAWESVKAAGPGVVVSPLGRIMLWVATGMILGNLVGMIHSKKGRMHHE